MRWIPMVSFVVFLFLWLVSGCQRGTPRSRRPKPGIKVSIWRRTKKADLAGLFAPGASRAGRAARYNPPTIVTSGALLIDPNVPRQLPCSHGKAGNELACDDRKAGRLPDAPARPARRDLGRVSGSPVVA